MVNNLKTGANEMWCDACDQLSYSTNTTYRITKKGKTIRIEHCNKCRSTIETEVIVANTFRIKNKTTKKNRSK